MSRRLTTATRRVKSGSTRIGIDPHVGPWESDSARIIGPWWIEPSSRRACGRSSNAAPQVSRLSTSSEAWPAEALGRPVTWTWPCSSTRTPRGTGCARPGRRPEHGPVRPDPPGPARRTAPGRPRTLGAHPFRGSRAERVFRSQALPGPLPAGEPGDAGTPVTDPDLVAKKLAVIETSVRELRTLARPRPSPGT